MLANAASRGRGSGPAAPAPLRHALSKYSSGVAVERVPSLAGALLSAVRSASIEHGSARSSANPGKVFGNAPARSRGRSGLALRGSCGRGRRGCAAAAAEAFLVSASVGSLRLSPELRASAPIVVPWSGASFNESNAGRSNHALERTAIHVRALFWPSARRRSARALGFMSAYAVQWRRFRLTTRLGVCLLIGAILSFVSGVLVADLGHLGALTNPLLVLGLLCWVAVMVLATYQGFFRCPRCHKFFSRTGWVSFPFIRRRCIHCDLHLYE
jgi:hypothetical protein